MVGFCVHSSIWNTNLAQALRLKVHGSIHSTGIVNPIYAMFRRTGVNIQVEVVWALSRAVICNLSICPSKAIEELKITISEHAKVPACFMDLICEDKLALDTHRLRVFGDGELESLEIQVLRKKPAKLLSIIRGWYMKDWHRYMREHDFQLSAVGSDLPMIEYIIATDDDGDLVNEKDEKWLPESEQPEDWLAWLTQEEFEDMTIHRNCTALHYAALLRDVHLCKLILDHPRFQEANAHCKLPHYNEGWTALHIACAIGMQDICLLLLQQPKFTAVWDRDADNRTALHYAMERGHPEVISAFLEHFDDVKSHTYTLEVLVDCCIHELFYNEPANHQEMVKLVVQSCAAALSSLPPVAIDWLMLPSNRKIFQDALKEQKDCGKLLAGLHLGNGHLDLELATFACDLNKDELAHRRFVKQRERRRRFLSAKAKKNKENTGRIWKSKASRMSFASKNTTSFQWPSGICLSNS